MKKEFNEETIQKNMDRLVKYFPHLAQYPFSYKGKLFGEQIHKNKVKDIANNYDKLAYPYHPNWSYCIPILPAYEHDGKIVDVGFHIKDRWLDDGMSVMNSLSNNIVYSNEGNDYGSSRLNHFNIYNKKLMLELEKLKIISEEDMVNMLVSNGFLRKFYESDLTGFDLIKLFEISKVT